MSDQAELQPPRDLDALIDRWHAETFSGSAIARDTEIWNLVHAATQDLKARLAAMTPSQQSPT